MKSGLNFSRRGVICALLASGLPLALMAQGTGRARVLITERIDSTKLHSLAGNTRSEANATNDRGRVPDDFTMEHMLLQLQRSPEQERAAQQLIDDLHNPKSPNFHHWMKPADFGQKYGLAQEDLNTITGWLQSHGFTVNSVYPSGMLIDFSGNSRQVREAFNTEIHYLEVNGARHVANMSDPQIPAALAPAISGVISLHDFTPHAMSRRHPNFTFTDRTGTYQALAPGDMATIYNLNPLFSNGVTGAGQTIAVIEDTDLYASSDWDTFRAKFGLSQYSTGSLTTVHPPAGSNGVTCDAPRVNSDDGEAILDAEWASAAAPGATIEVAACASTHSTFGGLLAMENLINSGNPPSVMSISYGNCEAENGSSSNAAFNLAYQQAVAEGISVFVAAGDEGAASCDADATDATHGIGVSGWASTPYNVAVGGTDFGDTMAGTNSTYWGSTNTDSFTSVLSYIPEVPWNDSCASALVSSYYKYTTSYGAEGFCGSTKANQDGLLNVVAGSGGPSGCATGTPTTRGVVSGDCQGFAKPGWQSGVTGIPNDGVRDIPDVSLFAGDGLWSHFYVFCFSDVRNGGASCTGDPSTWAGAGGTSFGAPIMAGIQALVNQQMNGAQGNPNYVYYTLAANGTSVCDSSAGDYSGSPCVFHNITQGDIAVNCAGTQNCYDAGATTAGRRGSSGGNGVLSTSNDAYAPAFGTNSGWNFATGIGSINAFNLVSNWPTGQ